MEGAARRLIETDLPIGTISDRAMRTEKKFPTPRGHIATLHVWWARRPLGVCRAVTLGALLPDPTDPRCPEDFCSKAADAIGWFSQRDLSQRTELRKVLLSFLGQFADWKTSTDERWVESARTLVSAAFPSELPLLVDPFAGGGAIPFEALRLGIDAFGGDVNPVAALLLKLVLEDVPRYGPRLTDAVSEWGVWVKRRVAEQLKDCYGSSADEFVPIAFLWARTMVCEGPTCGAEIPLIRNLWLAKKGKRQFALRMLSDRGTKGVRFEVFEPSSPREVSLGTVRGGSATCPMCSYTVQCARLQQVMAQQRGGTSRARLIAVVCRRPDGAKHYRVAEEGDFAAASRAQAKLSNLVTTQADWPCKLAWLPDERLNPVRPSPAARGMSAVTRYGMTTFADLFNPRQMLTLLALGRAIREAHRNIAEATGDEGLATAVATALAMAFDKVADFNCSVCRWRPTNEDVGDLFARQAVAMVWDFVETNVLEPSFLDWERAIGHVTQVLNYAERSMLLNRAGREPNGKVLRLDAARLPLPDETVDLIVTDPPYYDQIPYADLSDFFYVWLRRILADWYPDLFQADVTPKDDEIVVNLTPLASGGVRDNAFFERRMSVALSELRRVLKPHGLAVLVFAHRTTEGWEALLRSLVNAGWEVKSSWPVETEMATRSQAARAASLASSVWLVCRPRPADAGVGDWRQVLAGLNQKVADWLPRLADEGIQGADAIFSCLGPALEVYSQYERVETAGGQPIPLADVRNGKGEIVQRGYLSFVWEAVAREALKVIFAEADPTGFEEDARLTAMWLWTLRARANGAKVAGEPEEVLLEDDEEEETASGKAPKGYALPYDDARLIIQGLGAHEDQLKRPGGVLEVKGDKARLLSAPERRRFLTGRAEPASQRPRRGRKAQLAFEEMAPEPEEATAITPADTTLDRLHQAMLLFGDGRSEALRRFLVDDGAGRDERFWRLANALSALYPPSSQEKRWVDGVIARRRGLGL